MSEQETTELRYDPSEDGARYFSEELNAWYFPGTYEIPRESSDSFLVDDDWEETGKSGPTPIASLSQDEDEDEEEEE